MSTDSPLTIGFPPDLDIKALKAEHGPLRQQTIELDAPLAGSVEFIWREPTHKDLEQYQDDIAREGVDQNEALFGRLVVAPSAGECAAVLRQAPIALDRFLTRHVLPFLGSTARIGEPTLL